MSSKRWRIQYLSVANRDLIEIVDYIKADNPVAASELLDKIDASISRLENMPHSGKIPDDVRLKAMGYRILVVGNHLIFYVVTGNRVEIRRVLHGKRNYGFLL
ncbi:MAG: type II toxin-antitoxin system RelE/ParE family toxin [Desulfuromonadales bacterium]